MKYIYVYILLGEYLQVCMSLIVVDTVRGGGVLRVGDSEKRFPFDKNSLLWTVCPRILVNFI